MSIRHHRVRRSQAWLVAVGVLGSSGLLCFAACLARDPAPPAVAVPAPPSAMPTRTAPAWRPSQPAQLTPGPAPAPTLADWQFELRDLHDGPAITYAGNPLSFGSPLYCASPDWKTVHFWMRRDPLQVDQKLGRLAIASDPAAPTAFTLANLQLEATGPRSVRITADGHLDADVPAKIEYIPLCIPAAVLDGAEIETRDGVRLSVGDAPVAITTPTAGLRLRTRGGCIELSVADGVGLTLSDRRKDPYHNRQAFLIMAGASADQPTLVKGGRFHHVVDLTLPEGFSGGTVLAKTAPTPLATAPAAMVAEVPIPSPALCPQPRSVVLGKGRASLPETLVITDDGLGVDQRLAGLFADALAANGAAKPIRLGPDGWIHLRRIEAPAPERWDYHQMTITEHGVVVAAVSPAAASYALGTLAQLIEAGSVPLGTVEDWSDFRYRALHLIACDADALRVQSSFIRRIMVPLRYNQVQLYCPFVQWPSQPAIHHPQGMPYADFKALVAFAEDHLIAAIPQLAAYGHSDWLFRNRANLDLAEDPATPFAYDVSNPRTWELMRGILDDVRAAAPLAPWIHIGHDEVTYNGRYPQRPANLGKSLGALLAQDLAFYQDWGRSSKTALMLWSDYITGRSHPEAREGLQANIRSLDRSSVVVMWDYDAKEDYAECEPLLANGATVFGATGEEDVRNITTFASYAKRKGLPGMIHTTWTGAMGCVEAVYRWPRKLWPHIQAGQTFWNVDAPVLNRLEPSRATAMYDRMVNDLFPEVRRIRAGDRLLPIDLGPVANRSLAETGGFTAGALRTPLGGGFVLPGNASAAAGTVIDPGGSLRIPIGRSARAISLLWAGLSDDPSVHQVGTLAVAGAKPTTQPIIVRRQLGNLLHGLVTITDTATGVLLTRKDTDQNFSIARPVFPPGGRYVLWQYDLDLGGAQTDAVTITATGANCLIVVATSLVE